MLVQVTGKPVNFTKEGKDIIWYMSYLISQTLDTALELKNVECNFGMYGIDEVIDTVKHARDMIKDLEKTIKTMINEGLLKPNLPELQPIYMKFSQATNALNYLLNNRSMFEQGSIKDIKGFIDLAATHLEFAANQLMNLARLYSLDPPEDSGISGKNILDYIIIAAIAGVAAYGAYKAIKGGDVEGFKVW